MAPPTTVHDGPDHLLRRVLNLLDTHDAVIRAAAVCARWRRLSTRGLGSYMCSHRHQYSTCLSHYHAVIDSPSSPSPSHPSTPQRRPRRRVVFVPASPSTNPRHFSLDFLPHRPPGRPWDLIDGRGSLLLLASQRRDFFPDLLVCEPITRRFVRIHPIAAIKYSRCIGAFLGYKHDVISMSSFRVTCVLYDHAAGMASGGGAVVTAVVYNHRAPPIPVDTLCRNGWETKSRKHRSLLLLHGAESARYARRTGGGWWGTIFWSVDEEDGNVLCYKFFFGEFELFRLPDHVVGGCSAEV